MNINRKQTISTLSIILMILFYSSLIFIGCKKEPKKINIGGHTTIFGAVLMTGEKMGIFAKYGLDATVTPVRSSKESMAAMMGGSLDVVLGTAAAGNINMIAKGDLYIIADAGRIVPQLVIRKSLLDQGEMKEISDLRGRSVSVPREGSASWYGMNRILAHANLKIEDLVPKYLRQRETVTALEAGHIDASILSEPYTTVAIEKGIAVLFKPEEIAGLFPKYGQQYAVLFTTSRMIERPKILRKFLEAYLEAVKLYDQARNRQQPAFDDLVSIINEFTGVPRETIDVAQWPYVALDGIPDVNYIEQMQKAFIAKGLVEVPVNLSEVVNLSFLKK